MNKRIGEKEVSDKPPLVKNEIENGYRKKSRT